MDQLLITPPAKPIDTDGLLARVATLEAENQELHERVAALSQAESRFRDLVDAAGDVIWITARDPERVVYCSAGFERVWGHSVEDLYREPRLWTDSIHPDDRGRICAAFFEWLDGPGGRWDAEFRIVRADGQMRWIRERGVSTSDGGGKTHVIGASTDITDQRIAEAALRESEERFSLSVEGSADGIWDWDLSTDLMYMSERAQDLYGLSPSPATLRPRSEWLQLVQYPHADVASRRLAIDRYVAGETQELDSEWKVRQLDGTDRWRRVRGRSLRDTNGKMFRMSGSISDVDARKRAEKALEKSEQRYALAMEAAQDGHWDWNIESQEFHASPRMLEIFGLPRDASFSTLDEFLQRFPIHADDWPMWKHAQREYAEGRTKRFIVEARTTGTREQRWVRISGLMSRADSGKVIRWTGSVSDVTDRRAQEEALRESEERFALAVAGANDGIWGWDVATSVQYYSERAQRIFGLAPGPTKRLRSEWRRLVPLHPDDYHDQINAITDYLAGRTATYGGEWRVLQPGGGYKWIRLRGECVRDAAGLPVRLAGSISDIDASKREQASRQQSQRLEAVGTLAGGIAHDFNNILGAILGFGEMSLKRTRSGSRMRRDLECIITAGERGRALVDRILAFSRSSVSERVPVCVDRVAREAVELLKPTLKPDVALECEFSTGSAAILGDATQVHQVVGNLVSNAIQAMPDGGRLKIVLECMPLKGGMATTIGSVVAGPYIVLTVSDTGSGIAMHDHQRIFDPFFTTKEVNVGTGLGLSLVHGIVSELEGAIDVMSVVGEGSTFVVYLPRSGDVAESRQSTRQNLPRGSMQRILVVDDDPALTQLIAQQCADLGYQWMACTSSIEAARVFRSSPDHFDAVLTDERMPGMSGTALIEAVRRVSHDVPVIMMSGYLGDALIERATAVGANAVLAKPVLRGELAAVLAKVFPLQSRTAVASRAAALPRVGKRGRNGSQ